MQTLEKPIASAELKSANLGVQKIEAQGANNIVSFIRKNRANLEEKTEQLATIPKTENVTKNLDGFTKEDSIGSTILDVQAEQVGPSVIEPMSQQNLDKIKTTNETKTYTEFSSEGSYDQSKLQVPNEIKNLLPEGKKSEEVNLTRQESQAIALSPVIQNEAKQLMAPDSNKPSPQTELLRGIASGKPEYLPPPTEELKVTNIKFIDNQSAEITGNKPAEQPYNSINQVKEPQRLSTLEIEKLKQSMRQYAQSSGLGVSETIQAVPSQTRPIEISSSQPAGSINSTIQSTEIINQTAPSPSLISHEIENTARTNYLPTTESNLVRTTSTAIQEVSNRESFKLPELPSGSARNIPELFSSAQTLYDEIQNNSEMADAVNLCTNELLEDINPEMVYKSLGIELDQSLNEEEQKAKLKVAIGFVVVCGLISNEGILDQMNQTKPAIENTVKNPDLAAIFQLGIKNADTFNHANKINKDYKVLFETKYYSNPELKNQAFGEAYLKELTNNSEGKNINRDALVPQLAYLLASKQSEIDLRNPETNQLYTFNDIIKILEEKGVDGILENSELTEVIGKVTTNDVLVKENG